VWFGWMCVGRKTHRRPQRERSAPRGGDADKAPEISTPIAWPGLAKTKFDWDLRANQNRRSMDGAFTSPGGKHSVEAPPSTP